jgi:hypothetical protein
VLIRPAVDGTTRVLTAVAKAGDEQWRYWIR